MSHDCARRVQLRTRLFQALVLALAISAGMAQAATLCVNPGGISGCSSTISAAVSAAAAGDVIRVWPGVYKEDVVISKPLSLMAVFPLKAVIDATGLSNGIFINGMSAAPSAGVSNVLVSGFKVRNANFEGILIANAMDVTITGNHVAHNNLSLDPSAGACPGIPDFETNESFDCGEGMHLMGVSSSTIAQNEVWGNSGGILISDESGPTHDNYITGNYVHDNPWDCGITLASHGPAPSVVSPGGRPFGIMHNTIRGNWSWRNGLGAPGDGAGVGIFAPFPGTTNSGNVVTDNDLRDNGLPGVTMHNHAWAPAPAPPVNLDDNVIVGNFISGNAADTDDAATSGPTGINLFSRAPVMGTLIAQNRIEKESIDVACNVPSGQLNVHLNNLGHGVGVANLGHGTVDATENWWDCPGGPGAPGCATVTGTGITTAPWAFFPFVF